MELARELRCCLSLVSIQLARSAAGLKIKTSLAFFNSGSIEDSRIHVLHCELYQRSSAN